MNGERIRPPGPEPEHDGFLPAKRCPRAKWLLGAVERELPGDETGGS
ncbi:hypothetical protein ACQEU8_24275 [Streptomyces sp. CA-250714]